MATYTITARLQNVQVSHCTGVLKGSMRRLVIDRNIEALREFHRMGIPLDYALDCAVQKGSLPLIEEFLHTLGVTPSETTLLRAMQRGVGIRNMFLARVKPTSRHMNGAVRAANFDTALALLERGVQPDIETVAVLAPTNKPTDDRTQFIHRLVTAIDDESLRHAATLRQMALWTTIAQFERALDRLSDMASTDLDRLLAQCLRAAAPGHARALLNRGARFSAEHLQIAGDTRQCLLSDHNPYHGWQPVLTTVLATAVDEQCAFQTADEARTATYALVEQCAFHRSQAFFDLCELLARACADEARPEVVRLLICDASHKQVKSRGQVTLEELNRLRERLPTIFAPDMSTAAVEPTCVP